METDGNHIPPNKAKFSDGSYLNQVFDQLNKESESLNEKRSLAKQDYNLITDDEDSNSTSDDEDFEESGHSSPRESTKRAKVKKRVNYAEKQLLDKVIKRARRRSVSSRVQSEMVDEIMRDYAPSKIMDTSLKITTGRRTLEKVSESFMPDMRMEPAVYDLDIYEHPERNTVNKKDSPLIIEYGEDDTRESPLPELIVEVVKKKEDSYDFSSLEKIKAWRLLCGEYLDDNAETTTQNLPPDTSKVADTQHIIESHHTVEERHNKHTQFKNFKVREPNIEVKSEMIHLTQSTSNLEKPIVTDNNQFDNRKSLSIALLEDKVEPSGVKLLDMESSTKEYYLELRKKLIDVKPSSSITNCIDKCDSPRLSKKRTLNYKEIMDCRGSNADKTTQNLPPDTSKGVGIQNINESHHTVKEKQNKPAQCKISKIKEPSKEDEIIEIIDFTSSSESVGKSMVTECQFQDRTPPNISLLEETFEPRDLEFQDMESPIKEYCLEIRKRLLIDVMAASPISNYIHNSDSPRLSKKRTLNDEEEIDCNIATEKRQHKISKIDHDFVPNATSTISPTINHWLERNAESIAATSDNNIDERIKACMERIDTALVAFDDSTIDDVRKMVSFASKYTREMQEEGRTCTRCATIFEEKFNKIEKEIQKFICNVLHQDFTKKRELLEQMINDLKALYRHISNKSCN